MVHIGIVVSDVSHVLGGVCAVVASRLHTSLLTAS